MLFSFIVPVYNVEKYLEYCIESILVQTGADYEIVLLDDGSTDSSGTICDRYAEQYPNTVRVIHKENEGLLLTRRRGFQEARGEWYACVDSDDMIRPDYLKTVTSVLGKNSCDMVMFDYESFYPDGHTEPSGIGITEVQTYAGDSKKQIYEKRLLKNKYNNMWSKVIRADVVDMDVDYSIYGVKNMCEDAIQSLALFNRANRIVFLPMVLYSYRRNIQSITANVTMDYWHAMQVSYELGKNFLELWKMSEETVKAYASRCAAFFCDYARWLWLNSGMTLVQIQTILDGEICNTDAFRWSLNTYDKKYLATKYLRLFDPICLKLLQNGNYSAVRRALHVERFIRKITARA